MCVISSTELPCLSFKKTPTHPSRPKSAVTFPTEPSSSPPGRVHNHVLFPPILFFFYFPPFSNYGDYPVARFLVFASVTSTVSPSEGRNPMCRVLRPRCLSLHQARGRCMANIWCFFFFFFQMGLITNARPCPRGCRWCCGVRRKGVGQLSTFKCLCYAECSKGRPPSAKLRHLYTWLPSSLGLTPASWQVGGTWRAARWWWEGEVPSTLAHHSLSTAESHSHTPSCKRG